MYKLLQKYRRRLLAIATALLMVAFLLPLSQNRGGGDDYVVANALGQKIYAKQKNLAEREWELLRSQVLVMPQGGYDVNPQPLAATLGPAAVDQIEQHRDLFLLLQLEARKLGVFISDERVEQVYKQVIVPQMDLTSLEGVEGVKRAIHSYLMVKEAYDRAAAAVHVSKPMRDFEMATRLQQIKVNSVEIDAADYVKNVAPATPEQLAQLFEQFKNQDPQTVDLQSKTNPFGFGYRIPNRAALQYLMLSSADIRKIVVAGRTADRWKVDAWRYYLDHQPEFTPNTQPTVDASGMTSGIAKPATKIATTRPFVDVEKDVMEAMIQPAVDKLQVAIMAKINSILATDWAEFQNRKEGQPHASSLNVTFNSYEYLQKVAQEIQRQYNVTLTVEQWAQPVSARDMEMLGRIGKSQTNAQVPFTFYATLTDELYKTFSRRNPTLPRSLTLWQPSQTLRDPAGNMFVFRVTQRDGAHVAKDITEVLAKVSADWKAQQAFYLARSAADNFAANAVAQSLAKAAAATKKRVVDTDFFGLIESRTRENVIMGLNLSDQGAQVFSETAIKSLLTERTANTQNPVAVVPVYREGRIFVVRLDQVTAKWDDATRGAAETIVIEATASEIASSLLTDWFNFQTVVERLNYKAVEITRKRDDQPTDQELPSAPGLRL